MDALASENCVRVDKHSTPLLADQVRVLVEQIPDWEIVERNGIPCLTRQFKFENFNAALRFTNRLGQEAEDQGHHPAILTEWGRVTVSWWTHVIHGLHRNDFIMAARTDSIYLSKNVGG